MLGNGIGEPISNFTPARPATVKSLAGDFAYAYDEANPALLTKMTGPAHEVETSYEPHCNLITGVVNKAKPDSKLSTRNEEPSTLSSYTYANDLLGRRETISQGGEAFGMLALGANTVEVAYNDRSEVTGAVYRSNTETRQNFEYTYDAIGNRERTVSEIDSKRSELSYETNALNQYKKISANQRDSAVPYDPDGNLLEDARNTYTWNADNNLIRVDAKDGSLRLDYVYDHQSRRTVRIETKHPGTENEAQRTTYYLYDDWNLLAELEETKNEEPGTKHFVQRTFTWGRDLSGSLQGAGGVGGLLAITEGNATTSPERSTKNEEQGTNGETRFALYDANGNIGQLINGAGSIVAAYTYDPFGNVTEMAGAEAAENPWRFSTKPVEAGTGWLYYGFRWYDAEAGRWVNRDPIEESGGVNLYGFVGNDGVGDVDFLGLVVKCCGGASYDSDQEKCCGRKIIRKGTNGHITKFRCDCAERDGVEKSAWDAAGYSSLSECVKAQFGEEYESWRNSLPTQGNWTRNPFSSLFTTLSGTIKSALGGTGDGLVRSGLCTQTVCVVD